MCLRTGDDGDVKEETIVATRALIADVTYEVPASKKESVELNRVHSTIFKCRVKYPILQHVF